MGFEDDKDEELELRLSFGGRDGRREWVYARYAMGDQLEVIAADCGMTRTKVLELMREIPKLYEETIKAREAFTGLRVRRQLSIIDAYNLRMLERLNSGELETSPELVKELGKLVKELANRVRLQEGKATSIVRVDDEELTLDELELRMKALRDAGDGIASI